MVSNSTIRKYVTERIHPFRGRVFGYALVYSLLSGFISGTIGCFAGALFSMLGMLISIPVCALFKLEGSTAEGISNLFSSTCSSIISILISIFMFVLAIGYLRQMLLCVNNNNKTTPIDFFKLAFKDWKRSAKVYVRMILKYLPSMFILFFAILFLIISGVFLSEGGSAQIVGIILLLVGLLGFLVSGIWSLVIMIRYQTLSYELIYDEETEPKGIINKAKENIRGYTWQWTRMNFFYAFIFFIINLFVITLFFIGFFFLMALASQAGNGAAAISIFAMIALIILFVPFCIADSLLLQYFTAKNIYNLDELYKAILKEKSQGANFVPNQEINPVG